MPEIEDLLNIFGDNEAWKDQGDEWSSEWGSTQIEWTGAIHLRIQSFIPAKTILEIAPGFGRWTQFLKNYCDNLIGVDLAENCIEHCKKRFAGHTGINFFVNNGKTLNMVEDNSIDLIFSFDSLVHVEMDVLESYFEEFSRILTLNGVAFIHHSNIGAYKKEMEDRALNAHARASSVTYNKVFESCEKNNLRCITQETINWGNWPEYLIDCFSLICRKSAYPDLRYKLYENGGFMLEAHALRRIFQIYTSSSRSKEQSADNLKIDLNYLCAIARCQELEQYKKLLQDKESQLLDRDKLINELLNSRSWKLTAPLRAAYKFLRSSSS